MSLLNLFAAARTEAATSARKAKLARRPMIDCLEKREVFTVGVTGTAMGLAYRFVADSTGGGTMYVQDVAKGTNPSDRSNAPIAINQNNGRMVFDTDIASPSYGPSFTPGAQVKVVVAATGGDLTVYDDRNAGTGGLKTEDRHQTGNITVPHGYLSWTLDENVVTQQAVFTLASGASDHATYHIEPQRLNPESTSTDPSNPIIGLLVSDSGSDEGGPDFIDGIDPTQTKSIKIVTMGGANFVNDTPYTVSQS